MLYHAVVIMLWSLLEREDTNGENNFKITREAARKAAWIPP